MLFSNKVENSDEKTEAARPRQANTILPSQILFFEDILKHCTTSCKTNLTSSHLRSRIKGQERRQILQNFVQFQFAHPVPDPQTSRDFSESDVEIAALGRIPRHSVDNLQGVAAKLSKNKKNDSQKKALKKRRYSYQPSCLAFERAGRGLRRQQAAMASCGLL